MTDDSLFPLTLKCVEGYIIVIGVDFENQIFTLVINDTPFMELPEGTNALALGP